MAALSDYLENKLLNHIFRDEAYPQPTDIAIALTSGVPLDSDSGETLPELPIEIGGNNTNYTRQQVGRGSDFWKDVGVSNSTYAVYYPTSVAATSGYYYPLYVSQTAAQAAAATTSDTTVNTHTFDEFPGVTFYTPRSQEKKAQETNPNYVLYEGNGFIQNKEQIIFSSAHTDWGWVSGVAIVDDSAHGSGNMLMYAELTNPRYVYTGDNLKFEIGSLEICLK
jgi:hypothetical protein